MRAFDKIVMVKSKLLCTLLKPLTNTKNNSILDVAGVLDPQLGVFHSNEIWTENGATYFAKLF